MYYQQNPVFTIMILLIGVGAYFFLKKRGKNGGKIRSGFLSGRYPQQDDNTNMLLTLIMFQQLLDTDSNDSQIKFAPKSTQKDKEIDKIKHEVLELFEDG